MRRIPWGPLLFGILASWALLGMLSSREAELSDVRNYIIVGAGGGAVMLLIHLLAQLIPRKRLPSIGSSIGRGCLFGLAAIVFIVPIGGVAVVVTGRGVTIEGIGPGILVITAYLGLGILGGVWYARFRRTEAERQEAALAEQQLEIARDLQQRLLPASPLQHQRYRVDARNIPAIYVAGDFYDFIPLPNDRLLLIVADVAGKGVAAGLIMATAKGIIPLLVAQEETLTAIVSKLNNRLIGHLSRRDFVACAAGLYDSARGELEVANAGLPDPVLVTTAGKIESIVVAGPRYPLGIRPDLRYESVTVKLAPGTRVVFTTDGLPEAVGYERFEHEVARAHGQLAPLFDAIARAAPGAHDDDWTAVVLQRIQE